MSDNPLCLIIPAHQRGIYLDSLAQRLLAGRDNAPPPSPPPPTPNPQVQPKPD